MVSQILTTMCKRLFSSFFYLNLTCIFLCDCSGTDEDMPDIERGYDEDQHSCVFYFILFFIILICFWFHSCTNQFISDHSNRIRKSKGDGKRTYISEDDQSGM